LQDLLVDRTQALLSYEHLGNSKPKEKLLNPGEELGRRAKG